MGKLITLVVVAALAVGCQPRVAPAPTGAEEPPPNRGDESGAVSEVKLAEAVSAKPLEKSESPLIFVNVNSKGEVLLAPADRVGALALLDDRNQIRNYLQLRADEVKRAHPGKDGQPPRAVVILRVDKETPFAKTHAILKTCAAVGFVKYQWRVNIQSGLTGEDRIPTVEGQIPLALPVPEASAGPVIPEPLELEPLEKYSATVRATDAGRIEKIVLRSEVRDYELGAEVDAFAKKLKELRESGRISTERPATLTLEIDGKLRHEHVIQLIDASTRAGFGNMQLELVNFKERERPPE